MHCKRTARRSREAGTSEIRKAKGVETSLVELRELTDPTTRSRAIFRNVNAILDWLIRMRNLPEFSRGFAENNSPEYTTYHSWRYQFVLFVSLS